MNEDKTNDEQVESTQVEETPVEQTETTTEEVKETVEEPQTEAKSEPESQDDGEEIDLQSYWQERYSSPQTQQPAINVADEMSKLPTDEYGNVDEGAAAQWLNQKFNEVTTQAERRAIEAARNAFNSDLAEMRQQQQLLDKYPELKKDRDLLDTVFDLRDAAALRGQNVSLLDAAGKIDKLRQQSRTEGAAGANRVKTIQAAAHLETASTKAETRPQQVDLSDKQSRQELLKQFVQRGVESGEIQIPN